ncbi:class I SAM-dependent methyltransferase [Sandarakinorhabdus sp. AAP62]|uniref:class I SAM-dependent methyltransferase n=1 Tax=Sandarakinorhabdus sp. AAP62 TaxID=1248916 RepID=UPI000373B613|nr:class I SAM-dependent methyltransferase [Sandarakinorhabdus sp. AAP62]
MASDIDNKDSAYNARVQQQIDQFIDQPIHDLPEIFHIWSHNYIRPGIADVFGVESINDVYKGAVREASKQFGDGCRILSVGCGDGNVEIQLALSLIEAGFTRFRIEAVDLSPVLIERFREQLHANKLEGYILPQIADLNKRTPSEKYNVIMANHSLHHIVELEGIFDFIFESLTDDGIFATCDMIGRNGHMRWPESEAVLQTIWPLLSDRQRFHHQLLRHDRERFVDHDCSTEGFEGIRAQDILYLILNRFFPYKFFGYGGFMDVLTDRGYGPGFDQNNQWDVEFIGAMSKLNEMMLDSGMLKPTTMIAYFTKQERAPVHFRNRTARSSVRIPFEKPDWIFE